MDAAWKLTHFWAGLNGISVKNSGSGSVAVFLGEPVPRPVLFRASCYNPAMMDHTQGPTEGLPAVRSNRGWFQPGDRRINLQGRPRGSKAPVAEKRAVTDVAPRTDRLKRLFIGERTILGWLTSMRSPCVTNLPADFLIVDCRVDAVRRGLVFTIRSGAFPRVVWEALIPEMEPEYNGLIHLRGCRPGPVIGCTGG